MKPFLTLHHPLNAKRYYEQGLWRHDTFYGLLSRNATEQPHAPALQDGRRTLSWSQVQCWVDGIAHQLREHELVGGDRVSLWMSNRIEAVVTFLACAREGLACNPSLHKSYTCAEIVTLLRTLSTRVLVTEPGWGADRTAVDLDSLLVDLPNLKRVYTPDTLPGPSVNTTSPCQDPDKVAYLAFTSGTTGTPKCVMHSDNTLLSNARDLVVDWQHGPQTVLLSLSPLSHHVGWVAMSQWLLTGARFVTNDPPMGMSRLEWIESTGATYVMGAPTHALDILAEQRRMGRHRLGRVSVFYLAGSQIPPSTAEAFLEQGIKPQNVYGMTENSSHQYTHPHDNAEVIVATCGRGGKAYEVRLFDPADYDKEVGVGHIGHIGGRGAALMLGYFNNQTGTENSFNRDGWFMSGDLGILDAAGNLRIEGRIKDLIIRGGHNIYPAHIEAAASRHKDAGKIAAFPVPDERLGERVCIAVSGTVEAEELMQHLRDEGISKFDMPEYFLRVEEFPTTPSGKILKRELALRVRRGELQPVPVRGRPNG